MKRLIDCSGFNEDLVGRVEPTFTKEYKRQPEFIVRAPGRANIIGEHIDYSGFSVLPFALAQDLAIAGAVCPDDDDTVTVINCDDNFAATDAGSSAKFSATDPSFDANKTHWTNFVRCGFLAVQELLEKKGLAVSKWLGANLAVHGKVPMGSGLSSSSALVVAAALACIRINNLIDIASPVCCCIIFLLDLK